MRSSNMTHCNVVSVNKQIFLEHGMDYCKVTYFVKYLDVSQSKTKFCCEKSW